MNLLTLSSMSIRRDRGVTMNPIPVQALIYLSWGTGVAGVLAAAIKPELVTIGSAAISIVVAVVTPLVVRAMRLLADEKRSQASLDYFAAQINLAYKERAELRSENLQLKQDLKERFEELKRLTERVERKLGAVSSQISTLPQSQSGD